MQSPPEHVALYVPALREAIVVQDIEDTLRGGVVLPLTKLGEVWVELLLGLSNRLIHRFTGICNILVSTSIRQPGPAERTETVVFKHICLHTNSIEGVFPEKGEPSLHGLWAAILDLDQPAEGNSLEVFLALLVHEVASRNGPAFDKSRQRHGTGNREVKVVGGADGEVGEEFDVLDAVGSQLKVAYGETVFGLPPEWAKIDSLHASGQSSVFTE